MAFTGQRSIQSPGVELREFDYTLRPASLEGTSVFIAGFANQGPVDEILQPTSLQDWEQIYGKPTCAAEQYFYQTAKALFTTSPAKIVATRLPYGYGKGEGFFHWRYSALVYPAIAFESTTQLQGPGAAETISLLISDSDAGKENWSTLRAMSGLNLGLGLSGMQNAIQLNFSIDGVPSLSSTLADPPYLTKTIHLHTSGANTPGEVGAIIAEYWANDATLSANFGFTYTQTNNSSLQLTFFSKFSTEVLYPSQFTQSIIVPQVSRTLVSYVQGKSPLTIPTLGGNNVTNTKGYSAGNVYFFGKPTYVELSQEQYTQLTTDNIEWANKPGSRTQNMPFTFDDINTAGMIIVNKAQVTNNNNYEGYYVGIIDNNNYNPATPFNGIQNVLGIQSNTPEGRGIIDYNLIPETRLSFGLSAAGTGDGTTISEIMENLYPYDLSPSDFDDTITIGLFKIRKSPYTPDTTVLDYVLSESVVGSLDYHRLIRSPLGGPDLTFFVGEKSKNSLNMSIMVNPYISNEFDDSWTGDDGKPRKKVRFLSTQLKTPFRVAGNVDTADTYSTRVGAPSSRVEQFFDTLGQTESLFPFGVYANTQSYTKTIGQLPKKLERAFDLVENSDQWPLNLAVEAGLGTIYVNSVVMSTDGFGSVNNTDIGPYIDTKPLNALSAWYKTSPTLEYNDDNDPQLSVIGQNMRSNYNAIANIFISNAERKRKDFMVILDPLRQIFVQGSNSKVINTKRLWTPNAGNDPNPYAPGFVNTNFSQHIYWPLRHQFGALNPSSYAATYANWVQVLDTDTDRQIWVPFSGFAAAAMANTDFTFNPWQAPAGFTRGILANVNDLAIYPRMTQRDMLYKASFNPVTHFPGEGYVIFGQKTLLKKPSAFDRINVRRLFLYLETITKNTLKYFVFEPNTLFTRTQVINTLTPIFDQAKNNEGVYDYLIVCDERNNTPEVIDNNELKVDIYLKPVRTAEFILVSFYATRTSQNFQELVGG